MKKRIGILLFILTFVVEIVLCTILFNRIESYKIDSVKIATLVHDLGAGRKKKSDRIDYAVGVVLNKTIGDKITIGEGYISLR